jgi:hypothetical protein
MKTIRRFLGLYTEKELIAFGNKMAKKTLNDYVSDADLQNFKNKI